MPASLEQIAGAALSSLETVQASYDIARLAIERGIPGDFVECGVFAGAQCAAMAKAHMDAVERCNAEALTRGVDLRQFPGKRRVHLFDSFSGIPKAGPHDEGWTHPPGTSACSLQQVQYYMRNWGIDERLLVYHEGDFADTVSEAVNSGTTATGAIMSEQYGLPRGPSRIAVLRLDADLHDSTKTALEYLYPLVSRGGWIIVDDYKLGGCRMAVREVIGVPGPIYFRKDS